MPHQDIHVKFVLTGGDSDLRSLLEEYESCILNMDKLVEENRRGYAEYLLNTLNIKSCVEKIDRAFLWSKINLELLRHYHPGYGLGFMAGLPYFPIFFGRDSAWTILGVNAIGDLAASASTLLMLARFQAKDDGEDMKRSPTTLARSPTR